MKALLFLCLFSFSALAGFEKLTIQNLDLEYNAPYGKGMVEKVGIGLGLAPVAYPIEIRRTDTSLDLVSEQVDFSWVNPLKLIYELEHLATSRLSATLGAKDQHFVRGELLVVRPNEMGEFRAEGIEGVCPAGAKGKFDVRLLEDCRKSLKLSVNKVEVPVDFFLLKVIEDLPKFPGPNVDEAPANNLIASVNEGDLYLEFYVKFWFYAALRVWGHVQYENNYQTIALRVDQVKFGILPVTHFFLKKLKEVIKSPEVTVDPPWIRIDTRVLRENQEG
jgi:hypothetical protein